MGSWNDNGFADDGTNTAYDAVSARLYNTLLTAIPAACNGA